MGKKEIWFGESRFRRRLSQGLKKCYLQPGYGIPPRRFENNKDLLEKNTHVRKKKKIKKSVRERQSALRHPLSLLRLRGGQKAGERHRQRSPPFPLSNAIKAPLCHPHDHPALLVIFGAATDSSGQLTSH